MVCWNFPSGPVVKTLHFQCGLQVRSLVWELRCHILCSLTKGKKEEGRKEKENRVRVTRIGQYCPSTIWHLILASAEYTFGFSRFSFWIESRKKWGWEQKYLEDRCMDVQIPEKCISANSKGRAVVLNQCGTFYHFMLNSAFKAQS